MTGWKKLAAALDPPVPEGDLEKVEPVLEALESAFRPLQAAIPPDADLWTPEDLA